MHIVHIASELAPIAKVGGLADVVFGLGRELSWKGHDVTIIIPKYDCMDSSGVHNLTIHSQDLTSYYDGAWHPNLVWSGWVENLQVYFIDPQHPKHLFRRGCFYGCEDDIDRYLYFARAALEFLSKQAKKPDILHIHDWQVAAIAPLYYDLFHNQGYVGPYIVQTIHNLEYQGKCGPYDLDKIGLEGKAYLTPDKMQDPDYPEVVNLLKGGIVYSDFVTTVSPTYSKEVLAPKEGRGLDSTLRKHQHKFKGILNGIDYNYWNPESDKHLAVHFSPREVPLNTDDRNTLDRKAFLKNILRERLLLDKEHAPLVGCVCRLVPQKGIELIQHALHHTLERGGQFVLLGSSPIPSINEEFHALKHRFADHPHVHLALHHQEELAHMLFAGSDMLIVPSIFEPCGLTQMIALKYGTIPIVRETGGLADSIHDVDHANLPFEQTNGFTFKDPTSEDFDTALDRAIDCWFNQQDLWRKLMVQGMHDDFSWNHPSEEYIHVYEEVCHSPARTWKETL